MTPRWLLVSALVLAACEPTTKGVNINSTADTQYASFRVFDFLDEPVTGTVSSPSSTDAILTIENELPVSFGDLTGPVVTDYQQAAIGQWVAYISSMGTTLFQAPVENPTKGQLMTLIESGTLPSAALFWSSDPFPTLQSGQAGVRLVLGNPDYAADVIDLQQAGTTVVTLTSNAPLGQMTGWQETSFAADTLVVMSNPVVQFTLTPPAAGSFHTYAVVIEPTDSTARLMDIVESTTGGSAQITTAAATP